MKRPLIYLCGLLVGGLSCFVLPDYLPDSVAFLLPAMLGGFFLFFFSGAAFVATLIRPFEPEPTFAEASSWGMKRAQGKRNYVYGFVLKGIFPCAILVLLVGSKQIVEYGLAIQLVIFLTFVFVICVFSLIGIARLFWDSNERRYDAFKSKDSSR